MKKCKFCLAEIEDDALRCPCCGKVLEEAAEETVAQEATAEEAAPAQVRKATPGKIALAVAAVVVLIGALVSLIFVSMKKPVQTQVQETVSVDTEPTVSATVPADGEKGTVTEKGTYTVSDEEVKANKDTVVAVMDGKELTNGQLQVYYWMGYYNFMSSNYAYASYFGLDVNQPLDVQLMDPALHGEDFDMTWQQYFLKFALENWQQVQAVALEAEAAGLEMDPGDQETLDNLAATMEESVKAYDVPLDDYMAMNFGPGAGIEEYKNYHQVYYRGAPYYAAETAKMIPTDQEIQDYFDAHEEEYASGGVTRDTRLVDVRHILLQPENAKEDGTYADEDWAACEKKAQEILDGYLAGETTEDAFAALANEHSTDPGSNTNGGLYEQVYQGQMVDTFDAWCFDETRKTGDTGLVKTSYGYHIMYFVDADLDIWKEYAAQDWLNEKINELLENVIAGHDMEVFYERINLGLLMERQ